MRIILTLLLFQLSIAVNAAVAVAVILFHFAQKYTNF